MKKLPLLIAFQWLLSLTSFSQSADCEVITTQLDTLTGICVAADEKLTLAGAYHKNQVVFHPHEVLQYAIIQPDGTPMHYQFVREPQTNKRKSMRRLVDGNLKLYMDKVPLRSSVNPGLPKNSSVPQYATVYYIASHSEDAVEISAHNWKTILQNRLADSPVLLQNLGQKGFKFKNLATIIATYNALLRREIVLKKEIEVISEER